MTSKWESIAQTPTLCRRWSLVQLDLSAPFSMSQSCTQCTWSTRPKSASPSISCECAFSLA
jgi:hypothetical protein